MRPAAGRWALRVSIVGTVIVALVVVHVTSRSGVWWRLSTFTYQANILAAGFYAATLVRGGVDGRPGWRGATVLYVLVAGLVWNVFLTDRSAGFTVPNTLLHLVVPALVLLDWLLVGRSQALVRPRHVLLWLLFPLAYLALALVVLNQVGRRVPYFFLDAERLGWAGLATNVGLLALAFGGLGVALALLGRFAVRLRLPADVPAT